MKEGHKDTEKEGHGEAIDGSEMSPSLRVPASLNRDESPRLRVSESPRLESSPRREKLPTVADSLMATSRVYNLFQNITPEQTQKPKARAKRKRAITRTRQEFRRSRDRKTGQA